MRTDLLNKVINILEKYYSDLELIGIKKEYGQEDELEFKDLEHRKIIVKSKYDYKNFIIKVKIREIHSIEYAIDFTYKSHIDKEFLANIINFVESVHNRKIKNIKIPNRHKFIFTLSNNTICIVKRGQGVYGDDRIYIEITTIKKFTKYIKPTKEEMKTMRLQNKIYSLLEKIENK